MRIACAIVLVVGLALPRQSGGRAGLEFFQKEENII
jgi:hypothetical protein